MVTALVPCPACNGTRQTNGQPCPDCEWTGTVTAPHARHIRARLENTGAMTYNLAWRDHPHKFKVDQYNTPGLPCTLCGLTRNNPVHQFHPRDAA